MAYGLDDLLNPKTKDDPFGAFAPLNPSTPNTTPIPMTPKETLPADTGTTPLPKPPTPPQTVPQTPPGMARLQSGQMVPIGSPVPNMQGFVYNWAGGMEPGGAGNPVTGMPGATYGTDGYSVQNAPGASGSSGSQTTTTLPTSPLQATSAPASYYAPAAPAQAKQLIASFIQSNGLTANQADPSSLFKIVEHLRANGFPDAQVDYTDQNGHTGGIRVGGFPYQLIDGSNNWVLDLPAWEQSGGGAGGYGSRDYAAGFDDPATKNLVDLITARINQLMNPVADPTQAQLNALLQGRIGELSTPLQTPQGTQDFQRIIQDTIAKLQGPALTDPELANMQTRAFDTLNRQEQAEIENATRTLANHGIPPSSGLVEHAVQAVRNKFSELRAQQQQQLNQYQIDLANQRRAQLLQTAQTGSNVALTQQQQEEARKNQVMTVAQQLVELARQARGEQNTNAQTAISLAGVPVDITERRIANAANLGAGGSAQASSLTNTLSNLINGFNQQAGQNQQNSANYWQNLAGYLAGIDWSKVFH